jgi:hypothetical protein
VQSVRLPYPIIERATIRVGYTTSLGDPFLWDALQTLEQRVPQKGKCFFATFNVITAEYRASPVPLLGMVGIVPTLAEMRQHHTADPARVPMAYDNRHTEIVRYVPVSS